MKICVGLKNYQDVEGFIAAGAKEFYCGVIDEKWYNRYHFVTGMNRRPWPSANFASFAELRKAVKKIHENGGQVFYTINEHCYTNEQFPILEYYYYQAIESGVDAIIFADIGLLQYFQDKKECKFHISTGGTVFNSWSAKFYQEVLQVDRMILPRHLTTGEICEIRRNNPDVEIEIFILNEGCINIDGYCNHLHGVRYVSSTGENQQQKYSTACQLEYEVIKAVGKKESPFTLKDLKEKLSWATLNKGNCGICALYFFKDKGIDSLKLVGRASHGGKIEADIRLLDQAIALCQQVKSFREFYEEISQYKCKQNVGKNLSSCYYPDIFEVIENV